MPTETPQWFVITGGPCAGKTTTCNALIARGHRVLPEPARLEIELKLAAGRTIQDIVSDPDWLPSVVRRSTAQEKALPHDGVYFLDRATPDSVAYYRVGDKEIDPLLESALTEIRYRKVFLLDLVEYTTDYARPETPEQARVLHEAIRVAYQDQGYEIIDVPVLPPEERVDYILARIDRV
jgi:predicted ATPase